jgi:hypothetical protein
LWRRWWRGPWAPWWRRKDSSFRTLSSLRMFVGLASCHFCIQLVDVLVQVCCSFATSWKWHVGSATTMRNNVCRVWASSMEM